MGNFDWNVFIDDLWERENAQGKRGVEGKGGYRNGKYYPYTTPNGNTDIGPGFDLKYQTPEFRERAKKGFTKQELDSIVQERLKKEIPHFNDRITKEGGNASRIPDNIYAGLLDMHWQLGDGLYDFNKFWKAVANNDYMGMRKESVVTYKDSEGKKHVDTGRRDFRNKNYFTPQTVTPLTPPIIEHPDALRVATPYPTQAQNTVIVPTMVPDESSYINAHPQTVSEERANRVRNTFDAISNYNRLMDAIRIQNNPTPQYVPENAPYVVSSYSEGGSLKPTWDDLSMTEKAEMMKVAVRQGITNLSDIKQRYNEFAKGGRESEVVEDNTNSFSSGGSIHITPSHRGRLTKLKERTGKTEAELYNDGNPAHKKMVVFARSARKWKHGLGGNLFDGGGKPNIFRRSDGTYFYQADPDSEEITVAPLMTSLGDESQWTYIDEVGKHYTPQRTITQGEVLQGEEPSILDNVFLTSNTNYTNPILGAPARWKYSWTNDTNPVKALWNSPLVMANPYLLGVKTISNLAGEEGIPKTVKLYQNSDGTDNAQWLWQKSLAGDLLESTMLFPAAIEGYELGNRIIQGGKRFVQNVGDRHQGMKDAAEYAANNIIKSNNAIDATNYIWRNRQGPQASKIIAPYKDIAAFIKKSDGSATAVATAGGHQTINAHLGGTHYGNKPWEINPMGRTERMWLGEYMETAPQSTIFGEVGSTKNFAEQYNNVTPSWSRAIKDAILNKKEANNPYWEEFEEGIKARMAGVKEDKDVLNYYINLLNNNNPLSVDSYSMMLNMARRGKYDLRYDSTPMGLFNSQGVRESNFFDSLSDLSPKEKIKAINDWLVKFNPEARPAYLKNGEVVIPRPLLKKKTSSRNTWLKK